MVRVKLTRPRRRIKKVGFRAYTRDEQFEILILYLKRHPRGSLKKDIVEATGASGITIVKRLKQLVRLGKANFRHVGGRIRLYYESKKKF